MKATTQTPGRSIKQQINAKDAVDSIPLDKIFFEVDGDLDDPNQVPPLEQRALRTLAAYKRRQDEVAAGVTMADAVYHLMGRNRWPDRIRDYRNLYVEILAALTDAAFNQTFKEKLGAANSLILVDLLKRVMFFAEDMQANNLKPLMQMQEIKNDEISEEELTRIIDEYEARLEMSLSGRYKQA